LLLVYAFRSTERQRGRLHRARRSRGDRGGDPSSLGLEIVTVAETDHQRSRWCARVHQRGLLVGALDVVGARCPGERLGKFVAGEDQRCQEVDVDLGERLVGDLDAQGAAVYVRRRFGPSRLEATY
jgi:hypothetical protein